MNEGSPFPDPRFASDHGLVAIGGDFSPGLLLAAYAQGIFPWPSDELPRAWFSPDPRLVLPPQQLHVPRSLRKARRRSTLRLTYDTAFDAVIQQCAAAPRPGQGGTWITDEMIAGYSRLHHLGFAHSAEAWRGDDLMGGLYGVALGGCFSGESMFYHEPDASKIAFVTMVERLARWGFTLVDCQVHSPYLEQFGAREWPRDRFLDTLAAALQAPTRRGPWTGQLPGADRGTDGAAESPQPPL